MLTCEWCGREFERPTDKGRSPKYCSASHRGRASEERRFIRRIAAPLEDENRKLRELLRKCVAVAPKDQLPWHNLAPGFFGSIPLTGEEVALLRSAMAEAAMENVTVR